MENYENAGDKNGGEDVVRPAELRAAWDCGVSRKTSLNPVRVVSHPTLETSSNVRQRLGKRLGGNGGLEKSGTVEFTRKIVSLV